MTWNDAEHSISDGQPVILYEITRGDNDATTLYYTSADKNIEFNSTIYNAIAISDNGLNGSTENNITLTVPDDNPIVALFRGVPPTSAIRLLIRALQGTEARLVWSGKIIECRRDEPGRAELMATNIIATFSNVGTRLTWSRNCQHALFDEECKVNKFSYQDTAVITALTGSALTLTLSTARPDGWFTGGFIEWDDRGAQDSRHIVRHEGQIVELMGGTSRLAVGMTVFIFPGCGRTIAICKNKFDNHLNFGGIPGMPGISPFNGNKVF
jgi:uncharacterized phage protein (TIGR02218 family)